MPAPERFKWLNLATGLPGLVTNAPSSSLGEEQTPDATGLDMDALGYIKKGTIPSGESRLVRQYTVSDVYDWHYRRMWRAENNQLIYGAPEYNSIYFRQGAGRVDFNDVIDSGPVEQPIITFMPIGTTSMIVFKANGAYIIKNADSLGGGFNPGSYIQEAGISTATHAIEVDGIVYFTNSSGFFSITENAEIVELSISIRGNVTAAALTADMEEKHVMVGTALGYDIGDGKFFKYDGSEFEFISRKLTNKENTTISVSSVDFEFDKTSTAQGEIKFKIKTEERGWSDRTYILPVQNVREQKEHAHLDIEPDTGLSWQLKITDIPSNMKIKNIWVRAKGYTQESRDS